MKEKTVAALIKELSYPQGRETAGHAREIWQDGEVTLTKSGDLYGCRNLHRIAMPIVPEWFGERYLQHMDQLSGPNGNICVRTDEDARLIREAMLREYTQDSEVLVNV